jgi:hypothetical protein
VVVEAVRVMPQTVYKMVLDALEVPVAVAAEQEPNRTAVVAGVATAEQTPVVAAVVVAVTVVVQLVMVELVVLELLLCAMSIAKQ